MALTCRDRPEMWANRLVGGAFKDLWTDRLCEEWLMGAWERVCVCVSSSIHSWTSRIWFSFFLMRACMWFLDLESKIESPFSLFWGGYRYWLQNKLIEKLETLEKMNVLELINSVGKGRSWDNHDLIWNSIGKIQSRH